MWNDMVNPNWIRASKSAFKSVMMSNDNLATARRTRGTRQLLMQLARPCGAVGNPSGTGFVPDGRWLQRHNDPQRGRVSDETNSLASAASAARTPMSLFILRTNRVRLSRPCITTSLLADHCTTTNR